MGFWILLTKDTCAFGALRFLCLSKTLTACWYQRRLEKLWDWWWYSGYLKRVYRATGKIWNFEFLLTRDIRGSENWDVCVFQKLKLLAGLKDDWKSFGIEDDTSASWRAFRVYNTACIQDFGFCSQRILLFLSIGFFCVFQKPDCLLVSKMMEKLWDWWYTDS